MLTIPREYLSEMFISVSTVSPFLPTHSENLQQVVFIIKKNPANHFKCNHMEMLTSFKSPMEDFKNVLTGMVNRYCLFEILS